MDLGVFLPVSGRAASRSTLIESARRAEDLGFTSVWAADRVVMPWSIETPYPYAEGSAFIVPPDRPLLECLAVLSFLAGATERIQLGASVVVMNFRHPLHWLRQATTIDRLSEGRLRLGVGIGWMREEFAAMGVPFSARGRVGDEQLEVIQRLLCEDHVTCHGEFYDFEDVAFYPKAYRERLPIWVGGEGTAARRRAGQFGDVWFPYFVRITPEQLRQLYTTVGETAAKHGREVDLACCLPVEITNHEVEQEPDRLRGTPGQVGYALQGFANVGVTHVALQFMAKRYPERVVQVKRFAAESGWLD
ncbi:MAG TPA: TIGR03619 family F420-dependent LLM class oxidoreductase [Acidimicrobiia bacterium]|jgi:probable F420-dependent oxidoreductase|nr:TIGR03619 family F420-dependent LLM class oxidoreductase [Acidimicrobiia bacterium]